MRIRTALVAGAAAVGLALTTAPAATAGAFCDRTGICGTVNNSSSSKANVLIVNGWPNTCAKCVKKVLKPGQRSKSFFKDTDGFYVPTGWVAKAYRGNTYGPGWHKIVDTQGVTLIVVRP